MRLQHCQNDSDICHMYIFPLFFRRYYLCPLLQKVFRAHRALQLSSWSSPLTVDRIEVRNIAFITEMIVRSARLRKESRGLHFNTDYPFALPEAKDTVINIKTKSAGE